MSGTADDLQQAKQARAAHARAVRVANKEKREKLKAARVARMALHVSVRYYQDVFDDWDWWIVTPSGMDLSVNYHGESGLVNNAAGNP
ncbi:hypothetical protein CaCOL14_009633 [Colletotrichum acutatum]